jgi:hypothetical protein
VQKEPTSQKDTCEFIDKFQMFSLKKKANVVYKNIDLLIHRNNSEDSEAEELWLIR